MAAGVVEAVDLVEVDLEALAAAAPVVVELAVAGKHIKKGVRLDSFFCASIAYNLGNTSVTISTNACSPLSFFPFKIMPKIFPLK